MDLNYEMMYIVKPAEQEISKQVNAKLEKVITDNGGRIKDVNYWGERKLAYEINGFDQEELGDILDNGENIIYLFNNTFSIPLAIKNKKYIGVGKAECIIHSKDVVDFAELGIEFENVVFDEKYIKIEEEDIKIFFFGANLTEEYAVLILYL